MTPHDYSALINGDKMSDIWLSSMKQFLGPVMPLLEDESVSEIMINGPFEIWVEKKGKIQKTDLQFKDEDALLAATNNIAQSVGRRIDTQNPCLDARLPNGYRIHAVLPPCARNGTTVAIRKFFEIQMGLKDLIAFGCLNKHMAVFLDICMRLGKNMLISGGTGSGKTTLLSVLCGRVRPGQRIIVIEDSSELQIHYEHVVAFETQVADAQGNGGVSMQDLLKSSLRLRPDRIIVGEVRGAEALDLIQAMNTGHKGCLGTIHANTPEDALIRLEALAQGADARLSERALCHQIASAIDVVVQISRFPDGSRKITHVVEVLGLDTTRKHFECTNIYGMQNTTDSKGRPCKRCLPTGAEPSFMSDIRSYSPKFKISSKISA